MPIIGFGAPWILLTRDAEVTRVGRHSERLCAGRRKLNWRSGWVKECEDLDTGGEQTPPAPIHPPPPC